MIHRLLLLLSLCIAARATAADPAGLWAFRIDGSTLFQLDARKDGPRWSGALIRSADFAAFDEGVHTGGAVVRIAATQATANPDGSVTLRFDDPQPGGSPDTFRLHVIDADHAEAFYVPPRAGSLLLDRSRAGEGVDAAGPKRTFRYPPSTPWPSNSEMTSLFTADQADREGKNIDWSVVGPADARRRARTQQLIETGALHSGDDFLHASFVFQHGDKPNDFLLAHILAMVAMARGNGGAIWIAAATLDRYLNNIDKPQVLGTQYSSVGGKATQDPYDRALIPDALRLALRVPSLADQEEERKQWEAYWAPKP